jgi:hypothetical protein
VATPPTPSPTRDFFFQIARPTANEFLQRDDRRLGMLATIVLSHVADYRACEMKQQVRDVRRQMKNKCPAFAIVHDLADASKHYKLSNPMREQRLRPATRGALFGAFTLNSVAFNETPKPVMVVDPRGGMQPLSPIIQQVVEMWDAELG